MAEMNVTCSNTLRLCACLTVDAMCCPLCCGCCCGCCGSCKPFTYDTFSEMTGETEELKAEERCMATGLVQTYACVSMTITGCGCCWACCGTATCCAKCAIDQFAKNMDSDKKAKQSPNVAPAPAPQQMTRGSSQAPAPQKIVTIPNRRMAPNKVAPVPVVQVA